MITMLILFFYMMQLEKKVVIAELNALFSIVIFGFSSKLRLKPITVGS
jgi:hypothetical protein